MAYVKKSEREEAAKDDAAPDSGKSLTVKNISKNPTWVTGSLRCAPGESAIVSGRELEQYRRKIENGVKHGLLEVTE